MKRGEKETGAPTSSLEIAISLSLDGLIVTDLWRNNNPGRVNGCLQ
jgi:hypothetical protein